MNLSQYLLEAADAFLHTIGVVKCRQTSAFVLPVRQKLVMRFTLSCIEIPLPHPLPPKGQKIHHAPYLPRRDPQLRQHEPK